MEGDGSLTEAHHGVGRVPRQRIASNSISRRDSVRERVQEGRWKQAEPNPGFISQPCQQCAESGRRTLDEGSAAGVVSRERRERRGPSAPITPDWLCSGRSGVTCGRGCGAGDVVVRRLAEPERASTLAPEHSEKVLNRQSYWCHIALLVHAPHARLKSARKGGCWTGSFRPDPRPIQTRLSQQGTWRLSRHGTDVQLRRVRLGTKSWVWGAGGRERAGFPIIFPCVSAILFM